MEDNRGPHPHEPALRTSSSSGHQAFPLKVSQPQSSSYQGPGKPPQTPVLPEGRGVIQTFLEDTDPVSGGNSFHRQDPPPISDPCRQEVGVVEKKHLLGSAQVRMPSHVLSKTHGIWCDCASMCPHLGWHAYWGLPGPTTPVGHKRKKVPAQKDRGNLSVS